MTSTLVQITPSQQLFIELMLLGVRTRINLRKKLPPINYQKYNLLPFNLKLNNPDDISLLNKEKHILIIAEYILG